VPSNAEELRQRVVQLQRLLGDEGAARALQRWPGILGSRYAVIGIEEEEGLHGVFKRLRRNGHQLEKDVIGIYLHVLALHNSAQLSWHSLLLVLFRAMQMFLNLLWLTVPQTHHSNIKHNHNGDI
jgi:hypothetical protein